MKKIIENLIIHKPEPSVCTQKIGVLIDLFLISNGNNVSNKRFKIRNGLLTVPKIKEIQNIYVCSKLGINGIVEIYPMNYKPPDESTILNIIKSTKIP